MANNYSTKDLIQGVLTHCGERTDGTSPFHSLALKYINNVYKNLISGANEFAPEIGDAWTWARVTNSFVQPGYYSTGGADIVNGVATGAFTVAPAISLVGYNLEFLNTNVDDNRTWYEIKEHNAGEVAFTLDAEVVNPTGTNQPFRACPLIKDLGPGILRLVEPFRIYVNRVLDYGERSADQGRIYGVNVLEFWKSWPLRELQNNVPSKFTTIFRSESEWIVRFNKYVTNPIKIDWDCIMIPEELVDSTTSIPIVPFEYRDILVAGASSYLLMDKSQTEKSAKFFALTQAKIQAMHLGEEKQSKLLGVIFGQMIPRLDDTAIPWYINHPS